MTLRTDAPDLTAPLPRTASPRTRRTLRWVVIAVASVGVIGIGANALRGTGVLSWIRNAIGIAPVVPTPPLPPPMPKVPNIIGTIPDDAATGVDPAAPIIVRLELPAAPLDPATVSDDSVALFRFDTRERIPAKVTIVPEGLRVDPLKPLEANRNYRFHIMPGLQDLAGTKIKQNTKAFFTSAKPPAGVAFDRVAQPEAKGEGFTCLNFGPDGKLYAATHDGKLIRYQVSADGMLSNKEVFTTIKDREGIRLFTGFTFDPASTADAMVIYATHSDFGFDDAKDWTGKVSRLSGPKFEKLDDLVVNLPRSARDHSTNQPKFGPDGALYIPQPSNTAIGGPDDYWKMRFEHGLCATILRLDVKAMKPGDTIDAKTTESGGPFVWNSTNTPLTVYAMGLRMPYDLLWHSNGNLYTSVNGASSRGATLPGTAADGTQIPPIIRANLAEHDWFFKIEKGRYYGHPNPVQGFLVLNGGNPTSAPDFNEVADYPVGIKPDPGWTPAIYDFGMHVSANGMVEYKSNRFGGALKGKLFVCRYNIGSDLLCIELAADGSVASAISGIPGTDLYPDPTDGKEKKLVGPLDVIEDTRNGNLYVVEYYERQPSETRITLLRAVDAANSATATSVTD